jgi:hypothetical protein
MIDKSTNESIAIDFFGEKYKQNNGMIAIKKYRENDHIILPYNTNEVFFMWNSKSLKLESKRIHGEIPWQAYYGEIPTLVEDEGFSLKSYLGFIDTML